MIQGDSRDREESRTSLLRPYKYAFICAAIFSGIVNILNLSSPIFMLQVYDRVISSRSLPTLVALLVLALSLHLSQAIIETIRSNLFGRIANNLDQNLSGDIFEESIARSLPGRSGTAGAAPAPSLFRDLDSMRTFLASGGPSALFDLPWAPIYILLLTLLHPLIGLTAVVGILLLIIITILMERISSHSQRAVSQVSGQSAMLADVTRRNAETAISLGMMKALRLRWLDRHLLASGILLKSNFVSNALGSLSRGFRTALQTIVIALGAFLVIGDAITPGVMIAASIILGRALLPIEQAIAHWPSFVKCRIAYKHLSSLNASADDVESSNIDLPNPTMKVIASHLVIGVPDSQQPYVRDINFQLSAGDILGVIGPSGSGKSMLARTIVGIWKEQWGDIRFDGSTINQWASRTQPLVVGYMPQSVELFPGTIAENISRFDNSATALEILEAAEAAGLSRFIRSLPDGFNTNVGAYGQLLSAGQRQRVALARALFRSPFCIVLDEPNAALDAEGEAALNTAIRGIQLRGGIAIIIAHRPAVLEVATHLLALAGGVQRTFGPRSEVMAELNIGVNPAIHQKKAELA